MCFLFALLCFSPPAAFFWGGPFGMALRDAASVSIANAIAIAIAIAATGLGLRFRSLHTPLPRPLSKRRGQRAELLLCIFVCAATPPALFLILLYISYIFFVAAPLRYGCRDRYRYHYRSCSCSCSCSCSRSARSYCRCCCCRYCCPRPAPSKNQKKKIKRQPPTATR